MRTSPSGPSSAPRIGEDDGQTWTKAAKVRPLGQGKFRVLLRHPRISQATGVVTLRVHAWDNADNEIVQTIDRAYGLRR